MYDSRLKGRNAEFFNLQNLRPRGGEAVGARVCIPHIAGGNASHCHARDLDALRHPKS